jgi:amino acid adenylation domain-containing protein
MSASEQIPILTPALKGSVTKSLTVSGDLYAMFTRYATAIPDRVAIYRDQSTISYGELASRIAQLGETLRAFGVRAQDRIGIQIARSPSFVIAVFAVIGVGGVFVPLSEDEPENRVKALCLNAGVVLLLKMNAERTELVAEPLPANSSNLLANSRETSGELSYILHTSGSTGVPKGVAIPKTALLNCLSWHVDLLLIGEMTTISHLNLTSFDFIIAEVLLPFVRGGSMAIPSAEVATNISESIEALAIAGVSIIQMVPTVMGRFLRALSASPRLCAKLDVFAEGGRMICNGEALPDSMRRSFYKLFPNALLYNCYGPTEACVAVTEYLCPVDEAAKTMYIGKPVPNINLYVVDEKLASVDPNSIGELLIGGAQIATGYVGNPEETSMRFIPVITDESVQMVYRTGDLVRVAPEGLIEFAGRNDNQVKYRSLRLELGEIEAIAYRSGICEEVRALVTELAESGGRQELILFVTPKTVLVRVLEQHLAIELPKDRMPTRIIALESMPMTDRGKLDRKKLVELARSPKRRLLIVEDNRPPSPSYRLSSLLQAIWEVTGREYLAEDLWPVAGMDSLALMDLELSLLEKGLRFIGHAYGRHGIMLRSLADELEAGDIRN